MNDTPTPTLHLRPLTECISIINRAKDAGLNFHSFQKFLCPKCSKVTYITTPDVFYTYGFCSSCDTIVDIAADGCNFAIMATSPITQFWLLAAKEGLLDD